MFSRSSHLWVHHSERHLSHSTYLIINIEILLRAALKNLFSHIIILPAFSDQELLSRGF